MGEGLDLLEEAGTAAEARRDLVVFRPCRPPAQHPSLEWTQHVTLDVPARARVLGEAADAGHPLRAAMEPACDFSVVDALLNQTEDPTLNRSKRTVLGHGLPPVAFPTAYRPPASSVGSAEVPR